MAYKRHRVESEYRIRRAAIRLSFNAWADSPLKEYVIPHTALGAGLFILALLSPVLVFLAAAAGAAFGRLILERKDLTWTSAGAGAFFWIMAVAT